jgi:hypothetical protein
LDGAANGEAGEERHADDEQPDNPAKNAAGSAAPARPGSIALAG